MSTTLALIALASANAVHPDTWFAARAEPARYSIVDVYTPWCGPCARLDREVLKGAEFSKRRDSFRFLKVNGDEAIGEVWQDRYHVVGYPTVLILDGEGKELTRIFGFATEAEFWKQVDAALGGGHVEQQMLRLRRGELSSAELVPVLEAMIVRGEPEYPAFRMRFDASLNDDGKKRLDLAFARYELLRHRKDYQGALAVFQVHLRLAHASGDASMVKRLRGPHLRALVGLGRDSAAMTELEAWIREQPDAAGAVTWFCGKQNFAPKWAEGIARAALKKKPKDAGMLDNLALLLARQGRIEEAIDVIGQARRLQPDDNWLELHERSLRTHGKPPF